MDENEEFEFRHRAEQESAVRAAPSLAMPPGKPQGGPVGDLLSGRNPIAGAAEVGLTGATSLMASIPAALAYGGAAVGKVFGADVNPADVQRRTQEALTYTPASESGKAGIEGVKQIAGAVAEPFAPAVGDITRGLDEAATGVGKISPTTETFMREAPAALEAATGILPIAAGARPLAEAASAARQTVSGAAKAGGDDMLGTLRAAGFKFRPSDVKAMKPGEKVPGIRREGLQEPAALKKDLTLENQANATRLAAEDLGLKDSKALMAKDYETLRKPHFEKYDEVNAALYKTKPPEDFTETLAEARSRAGFDLKDKPSTTQVVSALRRQERLGLRSDDTVKQHAAKADGKAADTLEDAMEARLTALGEDKLHGEYRASRTALAKIHDYESATRGGQVDPQKMRQIDKRSPGRLTGHAKLISDAADFSQNVVRHGQKATGVRSSVKSDSLLGGVKNAVKSGISKLPGMDVKRTGFQNKFGREADATERTSFADYGRRAEQPAPLPARAPQLGTGNVDFAEMPGVPPAASLGSELGLAPEPVLNPQQLPEAPPMMTADTPPLVTHPDGIPYRPSGPDPQLMAALAGELGIEPPTIGGFDYAPPSLAGQMAPDLSTLTDLAEQLGLNVDTPQPSLMTPVQEPVPFGPRVELERPPGHVGKQKGKPRG